MTQTQNRPAGNGAAAEQVGVTGSQSTHLPAGWHEQAEHEGRWWYAEGYADGYAAAERDIAQEIRAATGAPIPTAKAVIRWLIRCIDLDQREPFSSSANGTTLGVAEREQAGRRAA